MYWKFQYTVCFTVSEFVRMIGTLMYDIIWPVISWVEFPRYPHRYFLDFDIYVIPT